MLSDEELGAVLVDRLHDLVEGIEPSRTLIRRVEEIPTSAARAARASSVAWSRRRLIALPVPLAALVAGAVIMATGSAVARSLAVTVKPDGLLMVTINKITGVGTANSELRQQGIDNLVVVPMTSTCTTQAAMTYLATTKRPAPTILITRHRLSPGVRAIMAARPIGRNKIEIAYGRTSGRPPICVTSHGTGPGLGKWSG